MREASDTRLWRRYFFIAVLAWLIVDFATTPAIANPRGYYSTYMPLLLVFYVGYPLAFAVLRYAIGLSSRGMFAAMIAGIVVVEIVFTRNALLFTLPICLLAIPISLGHYAMVTFMPMWLAEGTALHNKKWVVATISVFGVGVLLNAFTQFSACP